MTIMIASGPRAVTAPDTDTAAVLRAAASILLALPLPARDEHEVPAPSWAIEIAVGQEPGFSRTVGATDPTHPLGCRPDGIRCERAQLALLRHVVSGGELVLDYAFQRDVLDGATWALSESSGSIPSWGIDATHLIWMWWGGLLRSRRLPTQSDVGAARELGAEALTAAALTC